MTGAVRFELLLCRQLLCTKAATRLLQIHLALNAMTLSRLWHAVAAVILHPPPMPGYDSLSLL